MVYTSGWLDKNLGITRDAIRYYREKGLLNDCGGRNPINNRKEYEEKDVDKIWSIKVLIDIGYTAEEIKEIMNNPNFDFYESITQKASQLEAEVEKKTACLEFVKTIKLTGRIPVVNQMGSLKYDDFIKTAKEHWNIYADPELGPYMRIAEKYITQEKRELSQDDLEKTIELYDVLDQKMNVGVLYGYFQILSDMQDLHPACETVQRVVRLLHKHWMERISEEVTENSERVYFFVSRLGSSFLTGSTAKGYETLYGKEGCVFIAKALIAYAGYDVDDL